MSKNLILVLGAAGFIGSNILDQLKKENCLVLATYHKKKPLINSKNIKFLKINLRNKKELKKIKTKFNTVIMCSGKIFNKRKKITKTDIKDNISINFNVIDYFLNKTDNFLWFSSSTGYPNKNKKLNEKDFFKGRLPLFLHAGNHSRLIEKKLELLSKNSRTKFITVRTPEVFGKFDNFNENNCRDVPLLIKGYLNQLKNFYYLDFNFKKNYIFATDLAKISLKIINKSKKKYQVFNVCDDNSYNLKNFINIFEKKLKKSNIFVLNKKIKDIKYQKSLNNSKVKRFLGFNSIGNLQKSIKKTIKWYSINYKIL